MKTEYTKAGFENLIKEFSESITKILKSSYIEQKTSFEVEREHKINKEDLFNIKSAFYNFVESKDK